MKNVNYLLICILALVTIYFLWKIPIWQLRKKRLTLEIKDYLTLENEFRKTIAQIIGGLFVLGGLGFTWDQIAATKETIVISQERLITDRYSKAIDQLGSSSSQERLGGIFALGKIALNSDDYVSIVNKVLATYIRQKSTLRDSTIDEEIQAAIDIISYKGRNQIFKIDSNEAINISKSILKNFDFNNAILQGAKMTKSDFSKSSFRNANLSNVTAREANFDKTNLTKATLSGSVFYGGQFNQAIMRNSTLKNVNFQLAELTDADLTNCDLSGANLTEADLTNAILYGTNLSEAKGLNKAQLSSAKTNRDTKLPKDLK